MKLFKVARLSDGKILRTSKNGVTDFDIRGSVVRMNQEVADIMLRHSYVPVRLIAD
jgi:hypothetical protein